MSAAAPITLLLVDDEAACRESMRRMLWTVRDTFPASVREAPDGGAALTALESDPVDCMLLDQRMPGGTGVEWIARFLAAAPFLAIVMVTGQGDESTAVDAMKQGAMDYLVKGSISAEALQRAILNAVEKTAMRRELEARRAALLEAERQRVMIESLGAACHHLGQPMSVITLCLHMMRKSAHEAEILTLLEQCDTAVQSVNDLLTQLQSVSEYRTEPYLDTPDQGTDDDRHILSIPGGGAGTGPAI